MIYTNMTARQIADAALLDAFQQARKYRWARKPVNPNLPEAERPVLHMPADSSTDLLKFATESGFVLKLDLEE